MTCGSIIQNEPFSKSHIYVVKTWCDEIRKGRKVNQSEVSNTRIITHISWVIKKLSKYSKLSKKIQRCWDWLEESLITLAFECFIFEYINWIFFYSSLFFYSFFLICTIDLLTNDVCKSSTSFTETLWSLSMGYSLVTGTKLMRFRMG